MKKLYPLITIMLFTVISITPRQVSVRKQLITLPPVTAVPLLPTKIDPSLQIPSALPPTYKQLRDDIAAMQSPMVVDPDGLLTDYFINFIQDKVKNSELSENFAQALLQAGMSLHAQLTDNNAFAQRIVQRNSQQINDIITSLHPRPGATAQQKQKSISLAERESGVPSAQPNSQTPTKPLAVLKSKESIQEPIIPEIKKPLSEPDKKPKQSIMEPLLPQEPHHNPMSTQPKASAQKTSAKHNIHQPQVHLTKKLSGPAGLQEFRRQSLNEPFEAFYAQAEVNSEWLKKALNIIISGQRTPPTKEQIHRELVGNATELMRELLHKNKVKSNLWHIFLESVEKQVIAFIDTHVEFEKKQIPSPIASTKKPQSEPAASVSKAAVSEPQQKSSQKPDADDTIPVWISPSYTLITKEFEIELLNYIFKNQYANQEKILKHFTNQVPKNLKNKDIIINSIKLILANTLQESPPIPAKQIKKTSTPPTISKKSLPSWIDHERLDILRTDLIDAIMNYFAKNTNASNNDIFYHLEAQLPPHLPGKKLIESQIKAIIEAVFSQ